MTLQFLEKHRRGLVGEDWPTERRIRWLLKRSHPTTDFWLTYYPNIVLKLDWEPKDLYDLGDLLGDTSCAVWDEVVGGNRVYRSTKFSCDDIARILLPRLTGIEFKDKAAFMRWFKENEKRLKWDKALGKFVVE